MALMNLDPDGECYERASISIAARSTGLGPRPFGASVSSRARGQQEWQPKEFDPAWCASPVRIARSKRAALRAWAVLATMRLVDGQARIESMDARYRSSPHA